MCTRDYTESQNVRGWKGPLWIIYSNPPAKAGSPKAGCKGPCPGGFWMSPERIHNPPGQPVPVLSHPQSEEVLPAVQMELPMLQFVPVAPCPVTEHHWKESSNYTLMLAVPCFYLFGRIMETSIFPVFRELSMLSVFPVIFETNVVWTTTGLLCSPNTKMSTCFVQQSF